MPPPGRGRGGAVADATLAFSLLVLPPPPPPACMGFDISCTESPTKGTAGCSAASWAEPALVGVGGGFAVGSAVRRL